MMRVIAAARLGTPIRTTRRCARTTRTLLTAASTWPRPQAHPHTPGASALHPTPRTPAAGRAVVVDISEVEFIDSSIVRALAYGRKEAVEHAEHEMVIVAPSGALARRVLGLTGIDKMLRVYETRAEALAAI